MKFRYIIMLLMVTSIFGCTKKLELEPQQSIDANTALTTASDVEAALIGTYSILAGGELPVKRTLMRPLFLPLQLKETSGSVLGYEPRM